jgi:hypothetical protein
MQAAEAAGEDTGVSPTPSAPEAPAPQTTTESTEAPQTADTAPATGEEKWSFDAAEFDEKHPDLAPYRKQLQSSYTQRMQEVAEKQRAFEGIDEGSAEWLKTVNGLLRTDPVMAAQMLENEAKRQRSLVQQPTPEPPPIEFLSDGERYLYEQNRQLAQQLSQLELSRQRAEVEQIFAKLEQEAGRPIKFEERQRVAQWCQQTGIGNPEYAWKILNYEQAVQRGRDEQAGLMQQKSSMGAAPQNVASREAPPGDRTPRTQREAIQMAYEEAQQRSL